MKTNQFLLYDDDCPLCCWYTKQFVRFKLLEPQGRLSYSDALKNNGLIFNQSKARNEIALIEVDSDEIYYGVRSLLHVVGNKYKLIELVGNFFPVYVLLNLLYRLISYNRKIVVPSACNVESKCTPDVNLLWRVLFILFCGLTTNAIVGSYFNQFFLPQMRINFQYLDLLLFTGQILFQFLIFRWFGLRDFLNYAGHIAFISMMGALIMGFIHIVLSIFSQYGLDIGILASAGFGVALGFMLMVHIKRIGMIGQTKWLTLTWVIYRMMIYPLVFNL